MSRGRHRRSDSIEHTIIIKYFINDDDDDDDDGGTATPTQCNEHRQKAEKAAARSGGNGEHHRHHHRGRLRHRRRRRPPKSGPRDDCSRDYRTHNTGPVPPRPSVVFVPGQRAPCAYSPATARRRTLLFIHSSFIVNYF